MVAQAEHIPVHLGAMPRGGRGGDRARPAAGRRVRRQRPVLAAARTCPTSRSSRRWRSTARDPRLRGHARAPLRRRRHEPGLDAGRLARDLPGGARDPAGAARARRRARARRARARPRQRPHAGRAARRPARADRGEPASPSERLRELVERRGLDAVAARFAEVIAYTERRTREALRGAARRRVRAAERDRGRRRRPTTTSRSASTVTIAGDDAGDRLRRAPRRRSPATSTARSRSRARPACFALRVLLADDVPANAGAYAPLDIRAPRGLARQRAPPVRGRGRQRRDEPARRRHRPARAGAAGRRPPGAGAGHDEQRGHRRRRLDVLRDDRRRAGRQARTAPARPACTSA